MTFFKFQSFSWSDGAWQLNLGPLQVNYSGGVSYNHSQGSVVIPVSIVFWWNHKFWFVVEYQRPKEDREAQRLADQSTRRSSDGWRDKLRATFTGK